MKLVSSRDENSTGGRTTMDIAQRPDTREEAFRRIVSALAEEAERQEAAFFSDDLITEASTIDDDALTESLKRVLQKVFPERVAEIEAFLKCQPISRLLDLLGF